MHACPGKPVICIADGRAGKTYGAEAIWLSSSAARAGTTPRVNRRPLLPAMAADAAAAAAAVMVGALAALFLGRHDEAAPALMPAALPFAAMCEAEGEAILRLPALADFDFLLATDPDEPDLERSESLPLSSSELLLAALALYVSAAFGASAGTSADFSATLSTSFSRVSNMSTGEPSLWHTRGRLP